MSIVKPFEKNYQELSRQFKGVLPWYIKAQELFAAMYNCLTTEGNLSHKEAMSKIAKDHKDLPGFSRRNMYRALPKENPNVPRRVVPRRHKSSTTKVINSTELSSTVGSSVDSKLRNEADTDVSAAGVPAFATCSEHENHDYENQSVVEPPHYSIEDALEGKPEKLAIPKDRVDNIISAADKCTKIFFLYFDPLGNFLAAEPDIIHNRCVTTNEERTD